MWCTITHKQNNKVKINPKKKLQHRVTCWLLTCQVCHNHSSQAKEKDPSSKQSPLEQTPTRQSKPLFPPLQISFSFESIATFSIELFISKLEILGEDTLVSERVKRPVNSQRGEPGLELRVPGCTATALPAGKRLPRFLEPR